MRCRNHEVAFKSPPPRKLSNFTNWTTENSFKAKECDVDMKQELFHTKVVLYQEQGLSINAPSIHLFSLHVSCTVPWRPNLFAFQFIMLCSVLFIVPQYCKLLN